MLLSVCLDNLRHAIVQYINKAIIFKRMNANYSLIKVFIVEVSGFHCLQCKEGVSGLRDRYECLKYQVAGAQVMCEYS